MNSNSFFQYSRFKRKYLTLERAPFFEIGASYVKNKGVVLDIGSGEGDFFLHLKNRGIDTEHVYLLDGNEATVKSNLQLTGNSKLYLAPQELPFENGAVDLVHMSHLIDNLGGGDLYNFLVEVDRVIKPGGFLVISTPLLWPNFYDDLSHTRPYNPYVFYKYFVRQARNNRFGSISGDYSIEKIVYRYHELPLDEGWSSTIPALDILFISFRRILRKLSIKRLRKNGYTLVLKKGNEPAI